MSLIYNATFDSQTRILSLLDKAGNVISSCEVPSKIKEKYLTLTATEDNSSVALTKSSGLIVYHEYRKNGGSWTSNDGRRITLNAGDRVEWKCTGGHINISSEEYVKFVMTGKIAASNPVTSMIGSASNHTRVYGSFTHLFDGCTSLVQAPELPATKLAKSCYAYMFKGCTGLTQAPKLPATALYESCYSYMFKGCTGLTQAPKLPATKLYNSMSFANYCYNGMFYGCTSLVQAPELPAKYIYSGSYKNMFYGCTALVQAPELPATSLSQECYSGMFNGCTSLVQAPALPATDLDSYCYASMFNGCTSLVRAPALPATALAEYCYYSMFRNCTSLKEVRIAAITKEKYALDSWLSGVSSTGDFYCDPNATIFTVDSAHGIPKGWTRHALADYPVTP